jgi:formylmethanofuran dehydrogenase subunit E
MLHLPTIACLLFVACASSTAPASTLPAPAASEGGPDSEQANADEAALSTIRGVHGGAGPWVVAGYRMGRFALTKLGLAHGSFDLEVVHHAPHELQYSCIADGAAAATGASLGRLNLSLEAAEPQATRTTYKNRVTGATVTLQTTEAFALRYMNLPRAQLSAAGEEVLHLTDAEIFHEVPGNP